MARFDVVRATRTENNVTREGWIVERIGDGHRRHVSVLFDNEDQALREASKLEAQEGVLPRRS